MCVCVSTMTSSKLAADSQDHIFLLFSSEVVTYWKRVANAEQACILCFPARGSSLANWLTVLSASSAQSRFTSFCNFLSTSLNKTLLQDDAQGENCVCQNQILCIIYTQVWVFRNIAKKILIVWCPFSTRGVELPSVTWVHQWFFSQQKRKQHWFFFVLNSFFAAVFEDFFKKSVLVEWLRTTCSPHSRLQSQ